MENMPLAEHDHRYPAALSFGNLSTEFSKQGFNIAPSDVGTCWMREDRGKGAMLRSFHHLMVLFFSTECNVTGNQEASDQGRVLSEPSLTGSILCLKHLLHRPPGAERVDAGIHRHIVHA